ncbi:hypothetical protein [Williamsia sp. M5A3_1d]
MSDESIIDCASRWRYFAAVLDRSVDPVADLLDARCVGDVSVESTGLVSITEISKQVAAQWRIIGDALHCFGLGVRGASAAVAGLAADRAAAIAQFASHFDLLAQQPMVMETFERRSRAVFDEHYSAGLFAFAAGMRSAGDPTVALCTDLSGERDD